MAVVLKPPQRRLLPNGKLKIDWSHPLANGLIGCWVPGVSGGQNLANSATPDLAIGSGALSDVSQEGPSVKSNASSSGFNGTATPDFKTWTAFSLYWRGNIIGSGPAFSNFFGVEYDSGGGSPFEVAMLGLDGGGTSYHAQWNAGGTYTTGLSLGVGLAGLTSVGASFTVGGNVLTYSNNAGTIQTDTTAWGAGAPSTSATSQIRIGSNGGATSNPNASTYVGYMFNRALSAAEQNQLDADPYGFLIPAEGEMPALFLPVTTTSGGARIRQRWNRSPLAYPAGAVPGIDRSHPLTFGAGNALVSVIASGAGFRRVDAGGTVPITGIVTPRIFGNAGPNIVTGSGSYGSISGQPTGSSGTINMACVVIFGTFDGSFRPAMCTGSVGGTHGLVISSNSSLQANFLFGTNYTLLASPSVDTPYFVAVSALVSNGALNAIIVNLNTGVTTTATFASGTTSNGDGTFVFGTAAFAAATGASLSAAMISMTPSSSLLSVSQLQQIAQDPWAFWYPNKTINLASSTASAGASFLPVWAYRYNLPVLGTGNF